MSTFALAANGIKWMLLAQMLTSGGQLAYAALTARAFPPALFGAFAAALSLQGIITLLTTTGLPSYVLKQKCLSYRSARGIRWLALAGGGIACALFLALSTPWLAILRASAGDVFIPVLAVAQGLTPIAAVESSIMRRSGKSYLDATNLFSAFLVANGTGAALIVMNGQSWTLAIAAAIYPVALYLGSILLNRSALPDGDTVMIREVLSFSRKITAQNVVFLVLQQLPSWVLSGRAGAASLGHFSRAATLTGMPATAISTAINRGLQPHWRKLSDSNTDRAIRDSVILASAVSFPLFAVLAVQAEPLIQLWLGPMWSESASFVPLLAVAYGLSIPFTVVANSSEMRGLFRPVRIAQLAMAIGLVPGLAVLFVSGQPMWAGAGMALSQVLGMLTLLIQLPWIKRTAIIETLVAMTRQLCWAGLTCGTGFIVAMLASAKGFVLFDSRNITELSVGLLASALTWSATYRWNDMRTIIRDRKQSSSAYGSPARPHSARQ